MADPEIQLQSISISISTPPAPSASTSAATPLDSCGYDVSEISGFELDANNTDEGEVLDKIVERVVKNVKKRNLDEAAQDSENTALLEQQQQNRGKLDVLLLWCGKLQALCVSILRLFGVLLLWCGKLQALCVSILRLFGVIFGVAFLIFCARLFIIPFIKDSAELLIKEINSWNAHNADELMIPFFRDLNSSNADELGRPPVYISVPHDFRVGQDTPRPGYFIVPKNFRQKQNFTVRVISSATGQAIWWPLELFFILFMNMTVLYIL